MIGDLIGEILIAKGVLGAVVDGAVRDAATLSAQGLAMFARAATPAGPFKNGPGVRGSPVAIGGVVIAPGDIIVGDADGVAVIPHQQATWAADEIASVMRKEETLRRRITESRHH